MWQKTGLPSPISPSPLPSSAISTLISVSRVWRSTLATRFARLLTICLARSQLDLRFGLARRLSLAAGEAEAEIEL